MISVGYNYFDVIKNVYVEVNIFVVIFILFMLYLYVELCFINMLKKVRYEIVFFFKSIF